MDIEPTTAHLGRRQHIPGQITRLALVSAVSLMTALSGGLPASAATSSTRYVSRGGSNSAAGTSGAPWRTLQKAADSVASGGIVVIRAGTYEGFTTHRSGTSGDPTVFRGAPGGARPVVDGAIGKRLDVIKITGAHDVSVEGLRVTGARGSAYNGAGIRLDGATRITLQDLVVDHDLSFGINSVDSTHVTIRDSDIHHNGGGIQISRAGAGTRILDNRIHDQDAMINGTPRSVDAHDDTGGVGISFVRSTGAVRASGNRIWRSRAKSDDYGWDGSAFEIYGASNVTMSGNVVFDNENVLETGTDAAGPACRDNRFIRNVAYGATSKGRSWGMFLRCATNMLIAHDTFVDLDGFAFSIGVDSQRFSGGLDGLRIVDDIVSFTGSGAKVFGITTELPASVVIDHLMARTSGVYATLPGGRSTRSAATFTSWTGFQRHGSTATARFVSVAGHDFHLRPSSAAVDAGIVVAGVSTPFHGHAPDLGRYERR
jgi:Right handed beta helix region